MSEKIIETEVTEETVYTAEEPTEETIVVEETVKEEKLIFGRFKKSTVVKAGIGVAVLAGGFYVAKVLKDSDYDIVEEAIELGEEIAGE